MTLLSDLKIRQAKPETKEYTLKDGNGLFLNVHPNGSKYWLFRFSWQNKQKRMSFGTYPALGLKEARNLRNKGQELIAKNIDPCSLMSKKIRKNSKSDTEKNTDEVTFKVFAKEWLVFKLKKLNSAPSKEKKTKVAVVHNHR